MATWKPICREDRLRILTAAATAWASSFTSMRDNLTKHNQFVDYTVNNN